MAVQQVKFKWRDKEILIKAFTVKQIFDLLKLYDSYISNDYGFNLADPELLSQLLLIADDALSIVPEEVPLTHKDIQEMTASEFKKLLEKINEVNIDFFDIWRLRVFGPSKDSSEKTN